MSGSRRKTSKSSIDSSSYRSPGSAGSHRSNDSELLSECHSVYTIVFDSVTEPIRSKEELSQVLYQAGRNPSNRTLSKYWSSDTNQLSYNDFCDIMRKEKATSEADLIRAFKKIDMNGDGYISHDELYKVMTERGEKMTKAEVRAMIDEADDDGDRRLDYNEFSKMLMSTSTKAKQIAKDKLDKIEKSKKSSFGHSLADNSPVPSPRPAKRAGLQDSSHTRTKTALSHPANSKAVEPKSLRNWHHTTSKGSFHFDDDGAIISNQYRLDVPSATNVWLTIHSRNPVDADGDSIVGKHIDTALFIVREDDDNDCIAYTHTKHHQNNTLRCDLRSGTYRLIPFTTGCRFKKRRSNHKKEATLVKKENDSYILTKAFKDTLSIMFDMIDLDGNGTLSREEFDFFQVRTSGEHCDDDAWEVVEENFELKNGEITKKGFFDLHQMEANDSDGDLEDLWVTLSSMGFSKDLTLDEASSFQLDIYTEDARVKLKALEASEGGHALENALCSTSIRDGVETRIKGMKDLTMFTYTGDTRASIVLDNKSHSKVRVRLDCLKSKNCCSHRGNLDYTVDVPSKSKVVSCHTCSFTLFCNSCGFHKISTLPKAEHISSCTSIWF
ncbi:EF-hand calcium-binding domain-containing protein 7-like [Saccoglossus kowalevskii]|uniref:EF-hand calcium-binding domain-containing protein 7-like n=1 Tax=Saccoglossus kowalevskii TaxID=10224 RepID=A0ABM0LWX2_SACKO|nr:PREDICTED: EF-hand calcium-binding domain-containing protein 7-like [Saccoglossus kowalevskii]